MSQPKTPLNLSKATLRDLLTTYYHGDIQSTPKGFKICCPWHEDKNPSCVVFVPSGRFYCFACHGGGGKGVSAYTGFLKLGMDKEKAKSILISGNAPKFVKLETLNISGLDSYALQGGDEPQKDYKKLNQVLERSEWPNKWKFRGVSYKVLTAEWFKDRFDPTLVLLKRERLPRIALMIGGAERFKTVDDPNYVKQEVYLRLSSLVKAKAVNSMGMNLNADVVYPQHATLFGLINNKLSEECKGLIIVEGPFDCINLLQYIHEYNMKYDVIALLGSPQWSHVFNQIKRYLMPSMLSKGIPFILALDNDTVGIKLTKQAILDLQAEYVPPSLIKIFKYPVTCKDPGLLDRAMALTCLGRL